jgi:uncharacterized protein (TIGR03067 family)
MLEGEWRILSVDYGPENVPARHGVLQIIGPRFSLQLGGTPREVGAVEHDAAAEPATLDLIWRDAAEGETRRLRAIVRVRGELMQFCYYPETSGARPPAFSARGEPPAILVRCRRVTLASA